MNGRLPPSAIQRVVRQQWGRYRHCYEQGLMQNPGLEGRVNVRFVIGRDGSVLHSSSTGSDLPDAGVVRCVTQAFYQLSFPPPDGGVVTVQYPLMLRPD